MVRDPEVNASAGDMVFVSPYRSKQCVRPAQRTPRREASLVSDPVAAVKKESSQHGVSVLPQTDRLPKGSGVEFSGHGVVPALPLIYVVRSSDIVRSPTPCEQFVSEMIDLCMPIPDSMCPAAIVVRRFGSRERGTDQLELDISA